MYFMSHIMRTNEIFYIILKYLNDKKDGYTQRKIFFANNIDNKNAAVFNKTFNSLVKNGYIVMNGDKAYLSSEYFVGTLYCSNGVQFTYRQQDKFILDTQSAFPVDGDVVLVKISDEKRLTGTVVKVLKRTDKHIAGIFVKQGLQSFIIPEDKSRYKYDLFVENAMEEETPNYAKVDAILEPFDTGLKPVGKIVRVIRNKTDDSARNKLATLAKYGFSSKFSKEALEEAANIKKKVSHSAFKESVIVDKPVFIISDKQSAHTAYSAQKTKNGFEITVYTIDVASKIVEGSNLDKEARQKALSCCLNNEFINILPQDLIDAKISFSEGQKRSSVAFKLYFDVTGHRTGFDVFEAIVEPCTRVIPSEFMQYLAFRDESFETENFAIIEDLMALSELYTLMDKTKLVFKDNNRIRNIEDGEIEYKQSTIVDDLFYLLKTECEIITSHLFAAYKFPVIHSYYNLPSMFKIERLAAQCKQFDIDVSCLLEEKIEPKDIYNLIHEVDKTYQLAIKYNVFEMIGEKQYSMERTYNFAAGDSTCPIVNPARNYAALYNQRLLKRYIKKTLFNDNVENKVLKTIDDICKDLSKKAKFKNQAEKEYLLFSLVTSFMGEDSIHKAMAYSVSPSGVHVLLQTGIPGLVRFDDYAISDKEFKFVHNNEERIIRLGDNFTVAFDYFDVKNNRFIFKYIEE